MHVCVWYMHVCECVWYGMYIYVPSMCIFMCANIPKHVYISSKYVINSISLDKVQHYHIRYPRWRLPNGLNYATQYHSR